MNFLSTQNSSNSFPKKSGFLSLFNGSSNIQRLAQTLLLPKIVVTLQKPTTAEPTDFSESEFSFADANSSDSESEDSKLPVAEDNVETAEKDVSTPSEDYVHPNPSVTICLSTADEIRGRSLLSCFRQLSSNTPVHDSKLLRSNSANACQRKNHLQLVNLNSLPTFENIVEEKEELIEKEEKNSNAEVPLNIESNPNKSELIEQFTYKVESKTDNSCYLSKKVELNHTRTPPHSSQHYLPTPQENVLDQVEAVQNVYQVDEINSIPNIAEKIYRSRSDQFNITNITRIANLEREVQELHKELARIKGNIQPNEDRNRCNQLKEHLRKASSILSELKMLRTRRSNVWHGLKHRESGGGLTSPRDRPNIHYYLPKLKNVPSCSNPLRRTAGSECKAESTSKKLEKKQCKSKEKEVWKLPENDNCCENKKSEASLKSSGQFKYMMQGVPPCQAGKTVPNAKENNANPSNLEWLPENAIRREIFINNFEDVSVSKVKKSEKTGQHSEKKDDAQDDACNQYVCMVNEKTGRAVCNTPAKPNEIKKALEESENKGSNSGSSSELGYKVEDMEFKSLQKAKSSRHIIREHEGSHKMHFTGKKLTAQPDFLDLSHGQHITHAPNHPTLKKVEPINSEENNSEYIFSEWKNDQININNDINRPKERSISEVRYKWRRSSANPDVYTKERCFNNQRNGQNCYENVRSSKDINHNIDRKRIQRQNVISNRNDNGMYNANEPGYKYNDAKYDEKDTDDSYPPYDQSNYNQMNRNNKELISENRNMNVTWRRNGGAKNRIFKTKEYRDNGARTYAQMTDSANAIPIYNNCDYKYVTQDCIESQAQKLSLSNQQTNNRHLVERRVNRGANQKCCCDPQMLVENIRVKDEGSGFDLENKNMMPLIVSNLDESLKVFIGNADPNKIMLTIQIQRNNLYYIDIASVGSTPCKNKIVGCLYATECAVTEAINRRQLEKYLTFFVVNSHNSSEQKYRILSQSFVCMKRNI